MKNITKYVDYNRSVIVSKDNIGYIIELNKKEVRHVQRRKMIEHALQLFRQYILL